MSRDLQKKKQKLGYTMYKINPDYKTNLNYAVIKCEMN